MKYVSEDTGDELDSILLKEAMSEKLSMNTKITNTLLTIVAAGFLAWAGVVWNATSKLDVLNVELTRNTIDIHKHIERPYHEEAGQLHRLNQAMLARIDKRLSNIEQRLNGE